MDLEAVQWVVRMTSGDATEADRAALAQWCARSPAHQAALAEAYRVWRGVGPPLSARATARVRARRSLLARAAALLAVAALGYQAYRFGVPGVAPGAESPIETAGVLELDGAEGHCRLVLGSGDAYFDVTPNPQRQPAGTTDETHVRMFDTAFSVKSYASGVLVTVTGGRVEVNDGKAARQLTAGQQMRCRAVRHATA